MFGVSADRPFAAFLNEGAERSEKATMKREGGKSPFNKNRKLFMIISPMANFLA